MATALKDQNRIKLVLVVMTNVAIYLATIAFGIDVERWWTALLEVQKFAPVVVIAVVVSVLNAQISHNNKARIVFWRWSYPLPGSRAFSEYIDTDQRIDKPKLPSFQDPLPTKPDEQNALWFRWYREFKDEPGVTQVHREYLFTRDYAGLLVLMIVGLGALAFWQMQSIQIALIYLVFLVAQYLLVRHAAKNHGVRFVTTVLAYKAASS